MRRVLIPFSELFILLAIMFLVLFFVSAALGGKGESRSDDILHLVDISLEAFNLNPRGLGFDAPWLSQSPFFFVAASDLPHVEDGAWSFTWANERYLMRDFEWWALRENGKCLPWSSVVLGDAQPVAQWRRELLPNLADPPIPTALPAQAFKIMTGGKGSLLTATTRANAAPIVAITDDHNSATVFGRQTAGLSIAYRPEDIQRPIVIEAGLFFQPTFGGQIVFRYETASGNARSTSSTLFIDNVEDALWNVDDQPASAAPVYYKYADCRYDNFLATIRIFVTLTSEGANATLYDPRIDR